MFEPFDVVNCKHIDKVKPFNQLKPSFGQFMETHTNYNEKMERIEILSWIKRKIFANMYRIPLKKCQSNEEENTQRSSRVVNDIESNKRKAFLGDKSFTDSHGSVPLPNQIPDQTKPNLSLKSLNKKSNSQEKPRDNVNSRFSSLFLNNPPSPASRRQLDSPTAVSEFPSPNPSSTTHSFLHSNISTLELTSNSTLKSAQQVPSHLSGEEIDEVQEDVPDRNFSYGLFSKLRNSQNSKKFSVSAANDSADVSCFSFTRRLKMTKNSTILSSSLPKDMKPEHIHELKNKAKNMSFQLSELNLATRNFRESHVIGQGGFGTVYRGVLPVDGKKVAVKLQRKGGPEGVEEFITELEVLSRLRHKNLVKLHGYCFTAEEKMLVYEFVQRGSLFDHLHGKKKAGAKGLSWERRLRVVGGAAHGLAYLHCQCPTVLHRDVKSANILVTKSFGGKVSDFGGAKLLGQKRSPGGSNGPLQVQFVEVGMGTLGYVAPEVLMSGEVGTASDVFSFGVVLLEILTGKKAFNRQNNDKCCLVSWALPYLREANWENFFDPFLLPTSETEDERLEELIKMAQLASKCLEFEASLRPTAKEIASQICALLGKKKCGTLSSVPHLDSSRSAEIGKVETSVGRSIRKKTRRPPSDFVKSMRALMSTIEDGHPEGINWSGPLKECKGF